MAAPLTSELHSLLIRPSNGSLILGAAHHALYRPANALAHKVTGHALPTALDPGEWGAAAARAGEKVDYHLALGGAQRAETIQLDNDHLKHIGQHLDTMAATDPGKARALETDLNSVVADHYNRGETIRGLVDKAHADQNFRATLHEVAVPSATGEVGRTAKTLATDAAGLYGAAAITDKVRQAMDPQAKEKQSSMSKLNVAIEKIQKAASILDQIPARDAAFAKAAALAEEEVIGQHEVEKFAGLFERNPQDAETVVAALRRGEDEATKLASFGEVVKSEPQNGAGANRGRFEALCLENNTQPKRSW
jgi:hypothetical protein